MLKPGGILVYSTCSLNPLENEAVIASVIGDIGGSDGGGVEAIEIVPLPEWVERKCRVLDGLSTWKVPSPNFEKGKTSKKSGSDEGSNGISKRVMYSHFDDVPVEDRGDGKGKGGSINSSMFPPLKDLEIVQQLSRCGRFLPSGDLDSGGFFVACLRRLRVGELEGKAKAHNVGLGSTTTNGAKSKMALDEALGNTGAEVNSASAESSKVEGPKTGILSTDERCLREGDWICPKCNEMNFGRRGDSRCFKCKARNITVAKSLERKRRENDDNPQPLLIQVPNPCVPSENSETNHILTSFLHTFGISVDAKDKTSLENPFPLGNIRIMCRTNTQTLVLVSDSLANLAISSKWAPVRELGISLASFPSQPPSESDKHTTTGFNLFDEGLPLIAKYATRRHLKLNPIAFRKALAQSVCNPPDSASAEETKRIKGTVGKSVIEFDDICEGTIWYESIQGSSLTSAWEQCKAIPGYFIVSCDCAMQSNTNRIGYFSFSGRVDSHGNVYVETSLRIIAAMLVVVHYYIETNLTDYEHELGTKRRKIDAERK